MIKAIFRSSLVQYVLAVVLAGFMNLVKHTTRWQVIGLDKVEPLWAAGNGVIGALWHSRVLMTIAGWPLDKPPEKQHPSILISLSPDGSFIAKATKMLGVGVIRGSAANRKKRGQSKGGTTAFRKMMAHVEQGGCLAITPDGPRGPRQRASLGAVQLAAKTGAPILCFGWSSSRARFFSSWDRFCLPWPFAKGVIVWEGPIYVPKEADAQTMETKRLQMEELLNQATEKADLACGQVYHPPAGPAGSTWDESL